MNSRCLLFLIPFLFSFQLTRGQQGITFSALGGYRTINAAPAFGPGLSVALDMPVSKKITIHSGIGFYYLQNRVDYPVDSGFSTIYRLNGSSKRPYYIRNKKADLIFPFSISIHIWQQKKSQISIAPGLLFGYYLIDKGYGEYYQPPNEIDSLFQPGPYPIRWNRHQYTTFGENIFMRFSLSVAYRHQFSKNISGMASITVNHIPDDANKPTCLVGLGIGFKL